MIGSIAAAATAAAPYAGQAVLAGSKAVVGMAVATRATTYAKGQVNHLLDHFDSAKEAAKEAHTENTENVTPAKAKKASAA